MVAYSCRAYAMEQGISLKGQDKSPEVMTFLMALMDKLEVDKKGLPSTFVSGMFSSYLQAILFTPLTL